MTSERIRKSDQSLGKFTLVFIVKIIELSIFFLITKERGEVEQNIFLTI